MQQLLLSWAAEGLRAACVGIHELIYCKWFNMLFQSPESAIISAGLFTGDWVGAAFPLPQVVGSRKYTSINPGLGEGRNERPFILQLCKQSRGRQPEAKDNGGGGDAVQGLPNQGASLGALGGH